VNLHWPIGRYHSSIRHLYLHLHEVAMSTTHHMLFHSLENLLFKLSLNLEAWLQPLSGSLLFSL
jgi:hypothetical protein